MHVPGAGIRPYDGEVSMDEKGYISLSIGIHGIPVTLKPSVYEDLANGALQYYWSFNLNDKNRTYYKRVFLGYVRAVDFLESLEDFDGENLAITGGSQGGALSIISASLDPRIKYVAALFPALSDLTGFLHGRAGGWSQLFINNENTNKPEKIETSKYYDVVNFARFLKALSWLAFGYNDNVCPPTSIYATYNSITAPKEIHVFPETQYWAFPEKHEMRDNWLFNKLKRGN